MSLSFIDRYIYLITTKLLNNSKFHFYNLAPVPETHLKWVLTPKYVADSSYLDLSEN